MKRADGSEQTIYRTIGNNSSFGGNSLAEHIGLGDAEIVSMLEIKWPASGTTQILRDVKGDREIEITEGSDAIR